MASANDARIPRRAYGDTGVELSVVGFGGIVAKGGEQGHVNRLVGEMVERGINYFDVAPSYGDAIDRLGPALEPYRRDVFLACKTTKRDAAGAAADLDRCLTAMRTDHLDLFQLHALNDVAKDVDAAFAPGGAMETFIAARKEGRIRHIGFSAHDEDAAVAAMERYPFASALFPVNFSCWTRGGFGQRIMAAAERHGVARLALKALAWGQWPQGDPVRKTYSKCWYKPVQSQRAVELALRFVLSQPITAAVSPGEESLLRAMLDALPNILPLAPLTRDEQTELAQLASALPPIFPK